MLYYAPPSTPLIREAMKRGELGLIATPGRGSMLEDGISWCADNGCYSGTYPGDEGYLRWLSTLKPYAPWCSFVVAPDVPILAQETLDRSRPMFSSIRELGFPVALVAQNGLEEMDVPWDEFDVLFLGGDTEWKIGAGAARITVEAHDAGMPVHMGRVNSLGRLRHASRLGCASCDGTTLTRAPDENLGKLTRWLGWVARERAGLPWGPGED